VILQMLRPFLGASGPEPPLTLPPGVEVRYGGWIPALGGLFTGTGRAVAVTIGDTIVVHPAARVSPRLLRHELAHVRQWRAQPWSFAWRYAWQHLRRGYHDNPFEVAARLAETEHVGP